LYTPSKSASPIAVQRNSLTGGKSPRFMDCNFLMIADDSEEKGIEIKGFHENTIKEV